MTTSYREYSDRRRKTLSAEGIEAAQVFDRAYTVAAVILDARKRAGLTQTALSELSDIDQADISRIERGQMIPTVLTLSKLAAALGGKLVVDFGEGHRTAIGAQAPEVVKQVRTKQLSKLPPRAKPVVPRAAVAAHA